VRNELARVFPGNRLAEGSVFSDKEMVVIVPQRFHVEQLPDVSAA
jgi:hypothetical protein